MHGIIADQATMHLVPILSNISCIGALDDTSAMVFYTQLQDSEVVSQMHKAVKGACSDNHNVV